MKLKCSAITHTGNYRYHNEDSLLLGDILINGVSFERPISKELEEPTIVGIADGMGGHTAGHIASEIVLFSIREGFKIGIKKVEDLIKEAKRKLEGNLHDHPERLGMGTTISFIIFEDYKAKIGHVGDTRIYKINDGIELLTEDHTEAWDMYKRGIIDYESIKNHGSRNILTSALIADPYTSKPEMFSKEVIVNRGDIFLLCSDGFWEYFNDGKIYNLITSYTPEKILHECLKIGDYDNISFVICEVANA